MIDDDVDDHEIFEMAMEQVDPSISCEFVTDGIAALQKLTTDKTYKPDYIFLDLNMPRMSGRQVLQELKKYDDLKNIPVVVCSTSSEMVFVNEAKELGAAAYIVKPASLRELVKNLKEFFKL
ncbi:MAG: response regulator [Chitinophagaceae bacterium]|nr:response regulator [Chitinophagaceae bacterium]